MQAHTRLITAWRGFLLGRRRVWHPHHYFSVAGYRGAFLVGRPGVQATQFGRGLALVAAVFGRGGRTWTFGLSQTNAHYRWGRNLAHWCAGQISNSEWPRWIRRRGGNLPHSRVHRQGRHRRWRPRTQRRRLGRLPGRLYPRRGRTRLTHLLVARGGLTFWVQPDLPRRWAGYHLGRPHGWGGWRRGAGRAWLAHRARRRVLRCRTRWGRPRRLGRARQRWWYRLVRHHPRRATAVRRRRVVRARSRPDRPRQVARRVGCPPWPGVLLVGGRSGRIGLVREADAFGLPVVFFGETYLAPWVTPWFVVWGRGQPGVAQVVPHLWRRALVGAALHVVAHRLGGPAW